MATFDSGAIAFLTVNDLFNPHVEYFPLGGMRALRFNRFTHSGAMRTLQESDNTTGEWVGAGSMARANARFGGRAYIAGTVTGVTGACVVSLYSKERVELSRTKTDADGHYVFYGLRKNMPFDLRFSGTPNKNDHVHTDVIAGGEND
ncbi:hypothetical protein AGMMS49545_22580 [Betaproteobacteria bacterium]|nr:hypothetical protein AGMMS49545_22580 [Betaproteobacteria bacterium]GHU47408.1 hypothetical protein AGMMS50289_22560 [Betaproteobacteria bacterium]